MKNIWRPVETHVEVSLNQDLKMKIDWEDLYKLYDLGHTITAQWAPTSKSFYAISYKGTGATNRKRVQIHRLILDTPSHLEVDHKNHDTLDNRKSNIKNVTKLENLHNKKLESSSFKTKGYTIRKRNDCNRYELFLRGGEYVNTYGGLFKSYDEALRFLKLAYGLQ